MGGSLHVQRGLLHSSAASLNNLAAPLKVTPAVCMSTLQMDMRQSDDSGFTREWLDSIATILHSPNKKVSQHEQGWKVWDKGEHGIVDQSIPDYAWHVLRRLQEKGHGAYLVGGSVRDMLLKQVPKDFDVITTAQLAQVRRGFRQAFIVGRRFPVCNVHVEDKIVEVSSFGTVPKMFGQNKFPKALLDLEVRNLKGSSAYYKCHQIRWENSMRRDFTINGLFYDPFQRILYDYQGGVEDLTKKKVRTVAPADESFKEDSARILRALRIAGRLGFKFSRETAKAIQTHFASISSLSQDRLRLEAKYLMSYGSAERSVRLLWRFALLEILFPLQAAYFAEQGFKRQEKGSNMLLALMANLDKLLSPAKPCHCSLWINLLALHLALFDEPQSHVVVCALALAVRGNGLQPAVLRAIKLHQKYGDMAGEYPELDVEVTKLSKRMIKRKVSWLCTSTIKALQRMSDPHYVGEAMRKYPEAPYSDVVMLTRQLQYDCEALFSDVLDRDDSAQETDKAAMSKKTINREALARGRLDEVGFVFAHVVLSTLYPHAAKRRKELG